MSRALLPALSDIGQNSIKMTYTNGNSLVVQWLRLHGFTAEGLGSTPGGGTKIPQVAW